LLAARPDLVVLYASYDNRDAARALRSAGIPVIALRIDLIEDFYRAASVLGSLTGYTARAHAVIDSVRRTLERVRQATADRPRPSVFFHSWENPLLTIGHGSYLSQLVTIAGGRNIFEDLAEPSPQVSFEEVLRRNPDVVLASPVAAATLLRVPRWHSLPAIRDRRLLMLDTVLAGRPGVRLGEAAVSIANLLHPGVVR
jgi:iron complex transport system substrate-binding protein